MTMKRTLDVAGALVLIAALAPLLAAVALAVRVASGSPVLFAQQRVGRGRRVFTMYKFRTMTHRAEAMLPDLEPHNEMDGPVFKMTNDPRVTRLGAILRRYSLDELPQLYNVLRGDMSLVGPRPLSLRDYARFPEGAYAPRFSVRPGLTCTWQAGGRNAASFAQWMRDDLEYVADMSLVRDLRILARTARVVLRGQGK